LFLQGVSGICNELRYVVFSPVGQATGRRVAMHFFDHILHLDMAFHLERKTGALSRVMERGKRSVTMIFRAVGKLLNQNRLLFVSSISVASNLFEECPGQWRGASARSP
jgi:ABC-type transport system involved in Fe-S cluster assembly fused permease/ATPase subunit